MESRAFTTIEGHVYCSTCGSDPLASPKMQRAGRARPTGVRALLTHGAAVLATAAVTWLALAKEDVKAVVITSPLSRWTRDALVTIDIRASGAPTSSRPRILVNGIPATIEAEEGDGTLVCVAALRDGENEITAELGTSAGKLEPVDVVIGGRAQRRVHVQLHREQPTIILNALPEYTAASSLQLAGRATAAFRPVHARFTHGSAPGQPRLDAEGYERIPVELGVDGTFELDWPLPDTDGYVGATLRVDDPLGNFRLRTLGVWVDRSPPTVHRVESPDFTRGGEVPVRLTVSDASPLTVRIGEDAPPSEPVKKPTSRIEATWVVPETEGRAIATAVIRDAAGNTTPAEVTTTVVRRPPEVVLDWDRSRLSGTVSGLAAPFFARLLDGSETVEERRVADSGRFTFSVKGDHADFEHYVCRVSDAAGNVWEGRLEPVSSPAGLVERPEQPLTQSTGGLELDQFELLDRGDFSNALAKKIDHKVLVPRVLTEAEIRMYCEHAIAAEQRRGPIAGIWFFFLLERSDLDRGWTAGFAEWGPDGHAGNASDAPRGDYSKHGLRVQLMPEYPAEEKLTRLSEQKRKRIYRELYDLEEPAETERELQALHQRFRARYGLTEEELEKIIVEALTRHW